MPDYTDRNEPQETEEDATVTLTAEDGTEHDFTIIQVIKVDEKDYAILIPLQDEIEDDEAVILRVDQEDGEDVLVEIEDDAEFYRVAEVWEGILDEEEETDEDGVQ